MENRKENYIRRCFSLAKYNPIRTLPNPSVGAVLTCQNEIIAEGATEEAGKRHAEIVAIDTAIAKYGKIPKESILYVSLEPCCHTGKTAPCTSAIIKHGIKHVCISTLDPNPKVAGAGVALLRQNGITVETAILQHEGENIIKVFNKNITKKQPYVLIKYAQSQDNFIGKKEKRVLLSNDLSNIKTHKIRAEVDAILIGTNTAIEDNPSLSTRNYPGDNALRVVLDQKLKIPQTHQIFDGSQETLIIHDVENIHNASQNVDYVNFDMSETSYISGLLDYLHQERKVCSMLIEGGAKLITSFNEHALWDEAFVINTKHLLNKGIKAPKLNGIFVDSFRLLDDRWVNIKAEFNNS